MSQIIGSLRETMRGLHKTGAVSDRAVRELDRMSTSTVRAMSADEIKGLRTALKVSRPVLARHINTTAATVGRWERGESRPRRATLALLNIIADHGLSATSDTVD